MSSVADIFLFIGSVFMFLAALGLIRMPDLYTRLQAATKAVTLGAFSIMFGVLLFEPLWSAKLVLIIFFILLTSPVGASIIARSALMFGSKPWQVTEKDKTP